MELYEALMLAGVCMVVFAPNLAFVLLGVVFLIVGFVWAAHDEDWGSD